MTVARLVHYEHPGAIDTPLLLLADLREIDPLVELVHAGDQRWWLGAVSDNAERRARAELMMKQLEALERAQQFSRTVMLCKLQLQGFALIETYIGPDPTSTMRVEDGEHSYFCSIVEDFRERDAHWRRDQGSEAVKRRLLTTMREPERLEAEAKMKEYLYNDGRDHWRKHMRNRVQVGYEGTITSNPSTSLILTL